MFTFKDFIANIMQYSLPFSSEATDSDKNMEKYARESFQIFLINGQVKGTGLHVNSAFMFLGASPDGLVAVIVISQQY